MKKYYNKYNDKSAYDADSERKGLNASTVSHVNKDIIYDGVNVETIAPVLGDAVYHDGEKKVHFIKGDTVVPSQIPSDYVAVGVCGIKQDGKIFIIYKENQNKRFVEYSRFKITGWKLDGLAHTCPTVKLYQDYNYPEFTYTANTAEEAATQLNDFLVANSNPKKKSIAYEESGEVIMQLLDHNTWKDYSAIISGLSCSVDLLPNIPIAPGAYTERRAYIRPAWNPERLKEWGSEDKNDATYNPTSPITKEPEYPVCLPAYLGQSAFRDKDMCEGLRAIYGEGRGGWEKYIEATLPKIPYTKGMMSEDYLTGKQFTYLLKGLTLPDGDGGQKLQHPAVEYAASVGFEGVKGLEKGDWFGPNAAEFVSNMKGTTYGLSGVPVANSDPINRTLNRMGVSTLACSTYSWLFSRSNASYCWYALSSGFVNDNGLYDSVRVVPMALFPLKN